MKLSYIWAKVLLKLRGKAVRGSYIDKTAFINTGCNIVNSYIGRYSYCSYDAWVIETKIGSFCSISNNVRIGGPAHPTEWVSTSPVFYSGNNVFSKHLAEIEYEPFQKTIIGNDVWIGENVLIKAGVNVGNGAVIGMGSVVTKNIGAYEIWAGNPAKFIRKRFNDELCIQINNSNWWELSDKQLAKCALNISNPELFIKGCKQ